MFFLVRKPILIAATLAAAVLVGGCDGNPFVGYVQGRYDANRAALDPIEKVDRDAAFAVLFSGGKKEDIKPVAEHVATKKQLIEFVANNEWKDVSSRVSDEMFLEIMDNVDNPNEKIAMYRAIEGQKTHWFVLTKETDGVKISDGAIFPSDSKKLVCEPKEAWMEAEFGKRVSSWEYVSWDGRGYPQECAIPKELISGIDSIISHAPQISFKTINAFNLPPISNIDESVFVAGDGSKAVRLRGKKGDYVVEAFILIRQDENGMCIADFAGMTETGLSYYITNF